MIRTFHIASIPHGAEESVEMGNEQLHFERQDFPVLRSNTLQTISEGEESYFATQKIRDRFNRAFQREE